MKIDSVFGVLIVVLAVTQIKAADDAEECIKAIGLPSKENLKSYCPGNETDKSLTSKLKEVSYCILVQLNIMSPNGTVYPVKAAEELVPEEEKELMLSVSSACTLEGEEFDTLADKAEAIFACYKNKNSTLITSNCQAFIDRALVDLS